MSAATEARFIVADVMEILTAAGWRPLWPACRNAVADEVGTRASLYLVGGDSVQVVLEYALPGVVETFHLDLKHGATRVAKIILAAAEASED